MDLSDAIDALRESLKVAIHTGRDDWLQFELEPIELELEVVATLDMNGKIGWQILEVGASRESVHTQRLTLRLTPVWRTPDGLVRDFTIADPLPPGTDVTF